VLIVGQAPGARVHASGIPWDDASGKRLRDWLGVDADTFYDATRFAIVPMGFCYPAAARAATTRRGRNARRCGSTGCWPNCRRSG
jgi:uracil-DNA glycosylase